MSPPEFKQLIKTKGLLEMQYILSRLEKQIYDLKALGISRNTKAKLERTISKRNHARRRLLELLREWEKSGFKSEPLSYSDIVSKTKDYGGGINETRIFFQKLLDNSCHDVYFGIHNLWAWSL